MRIFILSLLLSVFMFSNAKADEVYEYVIIDCKPDFLEIITAELWNEDHLNVSEYYKGKEIITDFVEHTTSEYEGSTYYGVKEASKNFTCNMADGDYNITLTGEPQNRNQMSHCGAANPNINIEVEHNGKVLYSGILKYWDCRGSGDIKKVTISKKVASALELNEVNVVE